MSRLVSSVSSQINRVVVVNKDSIQYQVDGNFIPKEMGGLLDLDKLSKSFIQQHVESERVKLENLMSQHLQ